MIRASDLVRTEDVLPLLQENEGSRGGLIAAFEAIQNRYGYLPEDALRIVADRTHRSLVDIYGVATFYRSFRMAPRGRHLICACLGTACHVRGAPAIVEELERQLGIRTGETTPDREFTLETVNCLGACALGPIVVADGRYFSKVSPSGVGRIIGETRSKRAKSGSGTRRGAGRPRRRSARRRS